VWSRLIAVLLVLGMMPAGGEIGELVVHYVEHGDLAHDAADDHEEAPLGEKEHGCSGTFHLCSTSHPAPAPFGATVTTVAGGADLSSSLDLPAPTSRDGQDAPAPLNRPPIV